MSSTGFTAYEYKELRVKAEQASFYLDCYESFGWKADDNGLSQKSGSAVTLRLKRDRRIANKTELTRLQRHFEANAREIFSLQNAGAASARQFTTISALVGCAFMAGSVFAVTAETPIVWLCALLAVPGFAGWILPCFISRRIRASKEARIQPYIEAKYDEIYKICEKGHSLL